MGENFMQFHYIKYMENFDDAPELLASVVVMNTLEIKGGESSSQLRWFTIAKIEV